MIHYHSGMAMICTKAFTMSSHSRALTEEDALEVTVESEADLVAMEEMTQAMEEVNLTSSDE
jgi:hypothetical protein